MEQILKKNLNDYVCISLKTINGEINPYKVLVETQEFVTDLIRIQLNTGSPIVRKEIQKYIDDITRIININNKKPKSAISKYITSIFKIFDAEINSISDDDDDTID